MVALEDHGNSLAHSCHAYLQDIGELGYSPQSIAVYDFALRDFRAFVRRNGKHAAKEVSRQDLAKYRLSLIDRHFRANSIQAYMRAVRNLFRWLAKNRVIFLDPCEGLVMRSPPMRLLPVPSEDEVSRLLAVPNTAMPSGLRDRALLETVYGGGLRRMETLKLNVRDVNIAAQTVRVMGKGSRERVVPIGRGAARWLGSYLRQARPQLLRGKATDGLWVGRSGRLTYHSVAEIISKHSAAAGLVGLSAHSLRRACATHMLARGAPAMAIQEQLGHATLRHLSRYVRVAIMEIRAMHGASAPGQ